MDIRPEAKKQIESILGQKISDEALQLIILHPDVAISTHTGGEITQRHSFINVPNKCRRSRALDLSAHALTLDKGENSFLLTDFMCVANGTFSAPVNITATPQTEKPVYITVMHKIINNGADVQLTFFTWNPDGSRAPQVPFHWRCRVELA